MPDPRLAANLMYGDALREIKIILESTALTATPGEKLVRIGWVIGNLPPTLRESIVQEAQNRVVLGWSAGIRPTEF